MHDFILLEGPYFNRFFCVFKGDEKDYKFDENGNEVFKILGFADSIEEAQIKLYGRSFPLN